MADQKGAAEAEAEASTASSPGQCRRRSELGRGGLRANIQPGFSQLDWSRKRKSIAAARQQQQQQQQRLTPDNSVYIPAAEVARHKTPDDAWTVVDGIVYDVSPYAAYHPGGKDMIMRAAGKDGTSLFRHYHSWVNHSAILEGFRIGRLRAGSNDKSDEDDDDHQSNRNSL